MPWLGALYDEQTRSRFAELPHDQQARAICGLAALNLDPPVRSIH